MKLKLTAVLALVLALLTVLSLCPAALAHDAVDLTREGSITVAMVYKEKPVSGGALAIYRVGDILQTDGNYSFVLTADFETVNVDLNELANAPENAKTLAAFLKSNTGVKPLDTAVPDSDGEAFFDALLPGMYLVVQTKTVGDYSAIDPFLVSLPYMEKGRYCYDLAANPKARLRQDLETKPTTPSKIPQTGQLWWPVPLLVCAGLTLVVAGVTLNRRREDYEGEA